MKLFLANGWRTTNGPPRGETGFSMPGINGVHSIGSIYCEYLIIQFQNQEAADAAWNLTGWLRTANNLALEAEISDGMVRSLYQGQTAWFTDWSLGYKPARWTPQPAQAPIQAQPREIQYYFDPATPLPTFYDAMRTTGNPATIMPPGGDTEIVPMTAEVVRMDLAQAVQRREAHDRAIGTWLTPGDNHEVPF